MDTDEDLFNDDDFDLIGLLEKTEMEYRTSQLQKSNINPDTARSNTNANTSSILQHDDFQQQQTNAGPSDQEHRDIENTTTHWFSTLQPPEHYGLDYEKQKIELESALRHAARLRSELAFKNQELESTKTELREFKNKLQQQTSENDRTSMDIDPPVASTSTSMSTQSTQDPGSNTHSTSRRNTAFPSRNVFIRDRPMKRPRTSVSPSPGPSQRAHIPTQPSGSAPAPALSPPPLKNEVEIKEQREFDIKLGLLKEDIDRERRAQETLDGKVFYQCLGTVNFVKSHLDAKGLEHKSKVVMDIPTIILNGLRPPQLTTESDSILNALANDISRCISHMVSLGVKATISQIIFILRIYIQLCVQEEKTMMFIRATELICTLSMHYPSYITTHLSQEMLGAGDQSTLHFLTKGLALIPLKNADEGHGKGAYIQGYPSTTNMNYRSIKALLGGHPFGPSDTRRLLTGVTPLQAQETSLMILKLLSGLCIDGNEMETKQPGSTKRLLFLLDQKGFTDMISSQKPLVTTNEALLLVHALVADGNTDWIYVEKHRPLLKNIYSCLTVPRPQGILELKWYSIRQMAIRLLNKIMVLEPTPFSPEVAFSLALSASIYTLNNECLRIEDGYMPPFESVPQPESDCLLIGTITLMHKTLDIYPILLDYKDDDVYAQILAALQRFKKVMDNSLELRHQGQTMFSKLTLLLQQKNTLMVSNQAKGQDS